MATVPSLPVHTETLGAALDATQAHFEARGFTFGSDWFGLSNPFHTGGIAYETTKSATFELTHEARGKVRTKHLQVVIYRMPSGRYELVAYAS